jgi:hypothetical protein
VLYPCQGNQIGVQFAKGSRVRPLVDAPGFPPVKTGPLPKNWKMPEDNQ